MTILLNMARDINGYNSFGLDFSDLVSNTILIQNIEQHFTLPSTGNATYQNWLAVFEFPSGSSIWVARNATATIPGASFTFGVSELNPASRRVFAGDVLSFISLDPTNEIGVALYAIT